MIAYDLTTEHLVDPVGIDMLNPRLSWKCRDGIVQTAYQIHAASDPDSLMAEELLWDSGEVATDEQLNIEYPYDLSSRQRVYWRVRLKDGSGEYGKWSDQASFEMGLLAEEEKSALWIDPEESYDINSEPPVSLLRKEFIVPENFSNARLYISSLGMYEAYINDHRVGDQVLTPGFTDMVRRRQYQTYDITDQIHSGKNAVGVSLADGWARGRLAFSGKRNQFSLSIALWAMIIVDTDEGKRTVLQTDETWKTTKDGPCRMSDLRDGEIYDARMEIDGWTSAGFDDLSWQPVRLSSYDGALEGTSGVSVREIKRLKGKLIDTPDGRTVIDFGENIAGYVEFTVRGKEGDEVKLVHGEVLDKAGNFTMKNFYFGEGTPEMPIFTTKQEVTYILSGRGEETYKPSFTFMGFRYVLVEKWPGEVDPNAFTAIVVCSDLKRTVNFHCSNPLINKLYENTLRSQMGNFIDIPTDCPHRERMGWTGDAQIFCRTGSTNFDTQAFFAKWLRDVATTQKESGEIPNTVPFPCMPAEGREDGPPGSSGWGDAVTIIPYKLYQVYGDKRQLEEIYPAMKKWVDFEAAGAASQIANPDDPDSPYIWDSGFHWGEWLEPGVSQADSMKEPKDETATAYYAYSARLLSEMAEIIGEKADAEKYKSLSDKVRTAYINKFTADGQINGESRQCLYVRPLALGLLPEEKRQDAADQLARIVEENGYRIGTGFLSTSFICEVLTEYGHADAAYRMLLNKELPGWLYPITRGATTIWESWEGYGPDDEPFASHNHYAFGSVMEWVYRYMAGIDTVKGSPAYKNIRIAPVPGGGITGSSLTLETVRGKVACEWEIRDDEFRMHVIIPSNTTAEVVMPGFVTGVYDTELTEWKKSDDHYITNVGPGEYSFRAAALQVS